MSDEIEEVIEIVKQTDSQKSMATSNVYSLDFTDSSSDKHNSSGMETYVLEWDSEGSDSPRSKSISIVKDSSITNITSTQHGLSNTLSKESSNNSTRRSIVAQEICTQTSKTIIELAENDGVIKSINCNTLETQTSFFSISENKRVEYRIEMTGTTISKCEESDNSNNFKANIIINNNADPSGGDTAHLGQTEKPASQESSKNTISPIHSEQILSVVDKSSTETVTCEGQDKYECTSDFETSSDNSDIEEDSLIEPVKRKQVKNDDDVCCTPKSVNQEVAELYSKLYESIDFHCNRPFDMVERKRIGHLAPLVEESGIKQDSSGETMAVPGDVAKCDDEDKDVLFTNNAGIKVKLFPEEPHHEPEAFKLPPIQHNNSGHNMHNNLDFLFPKNNKHQQNSPKTFGFDERKEEKPVDTWEMNARDLASGESPLISGRSDYEEGAPCGVLLPPIHMEGYGTSDATRKAEVNVEEYLVPETSPISINKKIKELKLSHKTRSWSPSKYNIQISSNTGMDAADRGCELLCLELIKRLRFTSWYEIADTLLDIPNVLERFWQVMPEHRIADLLRLVTTLVESPRTQIARAACNTLAAILIKTNYTKKPDFYEAVAMLLIKTGSFSRPVRHAANVALDNIVCAVNLSDVITVLCIHGAAHKSPLVRCAAARLLVVCCALGGGGRALLRARPPTAATARRHALRSLAQLLDDKSTDTRKYALRLYSMLRPLSNFEAYYLTDVNVELASTQIKKFDQLLLCGSPETR